MAKLEDLIPLTMSLGRQTSYEIKSLGHIFNKGHSLGEFNPGKSVKYISLPVIRVVEPDWGKLEKFLSADDPIVKELIDEMELAAHKQLVENQRNARPQ